MVDWQVTTTTIYCDAIDDEATILVYAEGTTKCIGYVKYGKPSHEVAKLMKKKAEKLNRKLECDGTECHRVIQYRDRLFADDSNKVT